MSTYFENASNISYKAISENRSELQKYPILVGCEIEQAAKYHNGDGRCIVDLNTPNPKHLPVNLPDTVMENSRNFDWAEGHFDLSTPWEFKLGHDWNLNKLYNRFNTIVHENIWCWHNTFTAYNELRGASSHVHFSIQGDINLGADFSNQMVASYQFWTIYWNDWVTMLPFLCPFFAFGRRFRTTAFQGRRRWALPVFDRFHHDDTKLIFRGGTVAGRYTANDSPTHLFQMGHLYHALSWNRKVGSLAEGIPKKQITIELRLNEGHPYWFFPALSKINVIFKKTMTNGKSIRLRDHTKIGDYWNYIINNDVYDALFKMKDIEFHKGRNIPYICNEGQDKIFETGLDLFRAFCKRYKSSNRVAIIKSDKVMRMFSDFIDFNRVPSHLIWDINTLYDELYMEDGKGNFTDEAIGAQDRYLYYGHKIVLPPSQKQTAKKYSITNLL